ncbi:MAG: hypothetical protein COA44_12590 [Arcobacter sp.]|nr:MAG: hypothetical protein COA44_12590 [Arcobacter sp.]
MKKLAKGLSYLIVMFILLLLFLPKVNLYYAAEKLMQKQNIYISDEEVYDSGFTLELSGAKIFFDKLELMKVDKIDLSSWLVYSSIELKNIEVNEGFSDFLPSDITSIEAEHFFYKPMHISIKGESQDSSFYGDVDLIEKQVLIHLRVGAKSEKRYKTLLQKLNKEEGGYYYEYKF